MPLWIAGFVMTFPFVTPVADIALWAVALVVLWRRGRWPPMWVYLLPLVLGAQAVYGAHAGATGLTMLRVFCLEIVALWALERWDGERFAQGVLWGLAGHALVILRAGPFTERMQGMARYITILSNAGYMAFATYTAGGRGFAERLPFRLPRALQFLSAGVLTAAAGARAPLLGMAAHDAVLGVLGWRHRRDGLRGLWVVLRAYVPRFGLSVAVLGTFIIFSTLRGDLGRLDPRDTVQAAEIRLETILQTTLRGQEQAGELEEPLPTPATEGRASVASPIGAVCGQAHEAGRACGPGRLTWGGVGASAYLYAYEWPRPHSSYAVLAYEWGLWGLVPLALLAWLVQRRPGVWPAVVGLLALAIFDDTPLSAPEGHYLIAVALTCAVGLGVRFPAQVAPHEQEGRRPDEGRR